MLLVRARTRPVGAASMGSRIPFSARVHSGDVSACLRLAL